MKSFSALILFHLLLSFAECTAQTQAQILDESFDTVTVPDLPPGWIGASSWSSSSSSESPGSGGNNLVHTGSGFGTITLPSLDLTAFLSGFISYDARRTSSYSQANLVLTASSDGGATFPFTVISSELALPAATSSYQLISMALPGELFGKSDIFLRFEAQGGTSSGSNIRIDDLVITGTLNNNDPEGADSTAQSSSFGFNSGSSTALEQSDDVLIPLSLSVTTSIRGLQFDIMLAGSNAQILTIERGFAISDTTAWTVAWNNIQGTTRILVLSKDSMVTMSGEYDEFLWLRLETNALSNSSAIVESVHLSGVIGAMEPDSAGMKTLTAGISQHNLTILPRKADFQTDLEDVNFGLVAAGSSANRTLFISNPTGTTELIISDITSTNQLFSFSRDSLFISPGATDSLVLSFNPTQKSFGNQNTEFEFTHNGSPTGRSVIIANGSGIGGRGDANKDGSVDIGDVLLGIDAVLGIRTISSDGQQSLDVYPEFEGDSFLDVRDLGVLVEAILERGWTDGTLLPDVLSGPPAPLAAATSGIVLPFENNLRVEFEQLSSASFQIWIHITESIRGLELSIPFVSRVDLSATASPETVRILIAGNSGQQLVGMNSRLDPRTRSLRILLALNAGNELLSGSYSLGKIVLENAQTKPGIDYAVAYDSKLERITVRYDLTSTAAADNPVVETPILSLKMPYPNPWQLGSSNDIRIPFEVPPSPQPPRFKVYDILGRRIDTSDAHVFQTYWRWAPDSDLLVPGLYFIRMETEEASFTRSFSVIR